MGLYNWTGAVVGVGGMLIALVTLLLGRRKERDSQITEQAKINTKIDIVMTKIEAMDKSVNTALGGIEARFAPIVDKLDMHAERLAKVEESAKQAHKRIDEIKGGNRDV